MYWGTVYGNISKLCLFFMLFICLELASVMTKWFGIGNFLKTKHGNIFSFFLWRYPFYKTSSAHVWRCPQSHIHTLAHVQINLGGQKFTCLDKSYLAHITFAKLEIVFKGKRDILSCLFFFSFGHYSFFYNFLFYIFSSFYWLIKILKVYQKLTLES